MKQQFTIQAITNCTIEFEGTIEYSIDNGNTWCILEKLFLPAANKAQFRNAKSKFTDSFIIKGYFNVYGHISTLAPNETEAFVWMFFQTNVVDASKLILDYDELWPKAYYYMFAECYSLISAPLLSATTLAESCYFHMFHGCTGLKKAPELPATTLAWQCYMGMFQDCTSLVTAPELPATTLADGCYENMFHGCTRLKTAPELPATELMQYCYQNMFNGCTSLSSAPALPATKLAYSCYFHMFHGCTGMKKAPELPASTPEKSQQALL